MKFNRMLPFRGVWIVSGLMFSSICAAIIICIDRNSRTVQENPLDIGGQYKITGKFYWSLWFRKLVRLKSRCERVTLTKFVLSALIVALSILLTILLLVDLGTTPK